MIVPCKRRKLAEALKLQQLLVDAGIDTVFQSEGGTLEHPTEESVVVLNCQRVGDFLMSASVVSRTIVSMLDMAEHERLVIETARSDASRAEWPVTNSFSTVDAAHSYIISHL